MKREQVRAILQDEGLDESAKISKLLALHHDEVADAKQGLHTPEELNAAVAEALKKAPKPQKVEDTDEYKKLSKEYEDYKYTTEMRGKLTGAKVKGKFIDDIIAKIKPDEDFDKQIATLREQYGEYFDDNGAPAPAPAEPPAPTNKPVFGAGNQHTGGQQTAEDIELEKARSQWK